MSRLEVELSTGSPIISVVLGQNGRVEKLEAKIRKCHLKPRGKRRRKITARVRRFVKSMGVESDIKGVREKDEVGHLVGDSLNGPNDRTYNFIPQSPQCNLDYYFKVERDIYEYLEEHGQHDYVVLRLEMVYVDYITGLSPDRPRVIKVHLKFSDGKESTFELSNM